MGSEQKYYLGFSLFKGIGPKRFFSLLNKFGSAAKAWYAAPEQLNKTGLYLHLINRFIKFRKKFDFDFYQKKLDKNKARFISFSSQEYPQLLKEINSPPIGLFARGSLKGLGNKLISVIGTRKPTAYGRKATQTLVSGLVEKGFVIVSGLARGIDGIAHRVALGNKGRTISVLGSGVDVVYPPEHKSLAEEITGSGAVVSEFPLETQPKKGHFPARNRIVSGISFGVLVIEGAARSGTKNTTNWAADQGREVFAVPGPITSKMSQAPADLIQLGAKLVTSVEDVLEEY